MTSTSPALFSNPHVLHLFQRALPRERNDTLRLWSLGQDCRAATSDAKAQSGIESPRIQGRRHAGSEAVTASWVLVLRRVAEREDVPSLTLRLGPSERQRTHEGLPSLLTPVRPS